MTPTQLPNKAYSHDSDPPKPLTLTRPDQARPRHPDHSDFYTEDQTQFRLLLPSATQTL